MAYNGRIMRSTNYLLFNRGLYLGSLAVNGSLILKKIAIWKMSTGKTYKQIGRQKWILETLLIILIS
jgi:hypothetical protein